LKETQRTEKIDLIFCNLLFEAGAIDSLGGELLSYLLRYTKPWGNIVSIGLALIMLQKKYAH